MKLLLLALVLGLFALAAIHFARASQFDSLIGAANKQLAASQQAGLVNLNLLPEIVRRFAERNGGTVGGPAVVEGKQVAQMRLEPGQDFFPLTATQLFGTRSPAFVWHARATMMTLVPVEIVDSYIGDRGFLEARVASSITVAYADGQDTDKGEAMRFLAELPFNPDAILNAPALQWSLVTDNSVVVSLDTASGPARVRLDFDAAGDIVGIEASDRPRLAGTLSVPTPWIGRFSDYTTVGSYRLPGQGEVAWILPDGEFMYWRGAMTSLAPQDEHN